VVVYSSKIVKIGDQAHLFLEEGIVVFLEIMLLKNYKM
jgi:sorbitol-specific phosphotransferase system component IIA